MKIFNKIKSWFYKSKVTIKRPGGKVEINETGIKIYK